MARPICLRLFAHLMRAAASRTFCTAGRSRPIRIAMMALTTSSSISVKPALRFRCMASHSLENCRVAPLSSADHRELPAAEGADAAEPEEAEQQDRGRLGHGG